MWKRLTGLLLTLCTGGAVGNDLSLFDEVLPILSDKCFHCHGPDEADRKADLRLDHFEGATADLGGYSAVVPGDARASELVKRIFSTDSDEVMPPPESKLVLSQAEKDSLRKWVDAGAEYKEHWSFVKPLRPEVPRHDGVKDPIDAFVFNRLKKEGMSFSPEASPERLIRRVTLDLTGLPPGLDEVDNFVAAYESEGDSAYEALVDRLLDSPRYGEAMALPWLDAARYADTDGYQYDGPRFMWRWRDWVIDAYNSKMPFDQFTIEQLAGDLLPNPTIEQRIATGFNRNHRYNSEAGLVVEEFLLENAVDRVDTTSTLWMGLTAGCARCHDHKYDPISQKDYYQLIAFFNSITEAGRALKSHNSEPVIPAPTKEQQGELARREAALADAKSRLAPGGTPQKGGLLIDRKLLHHFPLKSLPGENTTVQGDVSFSGSAAVFDGQSSLEIPGIDKKATMRADRHFTISLWVKPSKLEDAILFSRQKGGTTRPGVEVALVDGGRVQFDLISRWVAGAGRVRTRSPLKANEWTHLAISNDGSQSANGQFIFINGERAEVEVLHNTNSNTGGVDEKRPLIIGSGIRPKSGKFAGMVRDVRLYDTDLWAEEIEILAAEYGGEKRKTFSRLKMTPAYADYVKQREGLEAYLAALPTVMVMKEAAAPKPTYIRNRGVYHDYGEKVERATLSRLPPMDESLPKTRLGLAKWLLSPEHPLTARVAVNRYWQKYFGTGLVKTAEDFGVQGEAPSHPDLLDWLAVEFRESGWDVAAMQKRIVMSRTYRQQSHADAEAMERDPDNRLLARGARKRLSGHVLRDQALSVSGLLKERIGGPSVSPYQPADLWAEMSMGMKYTQSKGDDLYRRSLYTIWKRTVAPPAMAVFDSADREACWVKSKETNTPLQALTLLNETAFVESARHLAVRMLEEGGDDPVGFGFRAVTARPLAEKERNLFESAMVEYQSEFAENEEGAAKLIAVGASPVNESFPASEIAAYTALANVFLNLDEVITRK